MKTASDILQEGAEVHRQKNEDYGSSWRKVGHILHTLANGEPVVMETPDDWIAAALFIRRMDKLARSFNGEFLAEEMNFASAIDDDEDESVYAAMQATHKAERQQDEHNVTKVGEPQ